MTTLHSTPQPRLTACTTLRGLAAALLGASLCASANAQETTLISVSPTGEQADSNSFDPSVSADGSLVAFESLASNLVADDTNNTGDIFIRDLHTGEVTRISTGPMGQESDGYSEGPAITPDGRFVTYNSHGTNLVAGDVNGERDIFLYDRETGVTELISVSSTGEQANSSSWLSRLTNDGRFVVFLSTASNLVPGDTNNQWDIFVRDRHEDATFRVSISSTGVEAEGTCAYPDISGDGRLVTFISSAENLVAGDDNGYWDVFLHDRLTGETSLVSTGPLGVSGDQGSWNPSISADGNWVVYSSLATNLVAGDVNGEEDVFLYDVQSQQTSLVSVNDAGEQADDGSGDVEISGDGRYVTYESDATNLVPGDTNGVEDIFVYDRLAGEVRRVSVGSLGQQADDDSEDPELSPGGRWVVFRSYTDALVDEDTNGHTDIFIHGPLFEEGPGPLETLATLDLFASHTADVRYSKVDGVITAGKHINLLHFLTAQRQGLTADSDVLISGGSLKGRDGVVALGNAVYGTEVDLAESAVFLNSSQDPRVDSPLDFAALSAGALALSTSWGMTPPTGETLIEYHNITLVGSEPDVNYFLVDGADLAEARMVTVSVPPGAACIINVDGGLSHKITLGVRLKGVAAESVLFNFLEAHRLTLGNWNLDASVLAPFARVTVHTIMVSGNLIAANLRMQNAGTQGRLFSTAPWEDSESDHFHGGEDGTDLPGYTLTWSPQSADEQVHLVYQSEDLLEVWVDGALERQVRLDRLERLVFTDRSDLSKIQIDPEITLPVELTGLAPVAQDDHAALEWGGSATADVLGNDLAGPAALDPSSVQVLTAARFGTVTVDPATGAVTYDCVSTAHKPAGLRGEVLEYTVKDASGNVSTPRRVRFSFEASDSGDLSQR